MKINMEMAEEYLKARLEELIRDLVTSNDEQAEQEVKAQLGLLLGIMDDFGILDDLEFGVITVSNHRS